MATNVTLSGSVRSNLLALQRTQSAIDVTNSRLNTGKKVNTVVDDAVAFFSAKALDDRATTFNERKDNIDQSISAINVALTATTAIDSLVKQLKGIVISAKSATATERGAFQTQFNTVKSQIDQLVADATYQGLNLISNSTATQTTDFSDRSASRLVVTAQRLTTYRGVGANAQANLSALNATVFSTAATFQASAAGIDANGSNVTIAAGATGIYQLTGVGSAGVVLNNTLIRYANTDVSTATGSNNTSLIYIGSGATAFQALTSRASADFAASRDNTATSLTSNAGGAESAGFTFQTGFNTVSGLNIFDASKIFIYVDAAVTGSFAITTISTGTLWSAAAFDPSTGLGGDQFTQALDTIVRGLDNALAQNNSVAKALGTNVAILNTRLEFTKEYVNVQKEGSGKLTLADTNEEGANLVSLQTRQQLGIQALSFAGQTEQSVLRLFG